MENDYHTRGVESGTGPVVRLENIQKTYGAGMASAVLALRGISLEVASAEFIAIMGSSGSGKSTLMNILGCLDRPSRGRYFLRGIDVDSLSSNQRADLRNQYIGFVFQNFHLLPRTSALENVELPLLYHPRRPSYRQMRERGLEVLHQVGLSDRTHHLPNQLSGGQQQRVAIARALVNRPSILLADEPTGNLDTLTGVMIMELLQQLNQEGLTILLVTHEPEICRFAKRVVVLQDGRVRKDTPVQDPWSASAVKTRLLREKELEDPANSQIHS